MGSLDPDYHRSWFSEHTSRSGLSRKIRYLVLLSRGAVCRVCRSRLILVYLNLNPWEYTTNSTIPFKHPTGHVECTCAFLHVVSPFAMVTISSSSVVHSHVPSAVGTIIGSIVLRNELAKRLPALFVHSAGNPSMYALIPELSKFSPLISFEVQAAFAGSRCCGKSALPIVAQDS